MNTKRNIAGILSLAVLLLLPAFAAAEQRGAVKKTVLPKLNTDNSTFRKFKPPVKAGSSTTLDNAEDSALSEGQSASGAGLSMGVPLGAGGVNAAGGTAGCPSTPADSILPRSSINSTSFRIWCRMIVAGYLYSQ